MQNVDARKVLTNLDDSKRLLAKLMAEEDITVQQVAGAPTAMFDVVSRILTIPEWSSLDTEQYDHLIGHEVGHALFTDLGYIASVAPDPGLMEYFNVVEDARIERKMRDRFPGLTRTFYRSYERFHAMGPLFKGTKTTVDVGGTPVPVKTLSLIDRINLYYKTGAFMKVPFRMNERPWIARIDRCTTMEEALQIARDLRQFAKDERARTQQSQQGAGKGQPSNTGQSKSSASGKGQSSDKGPQSAADSEDGEGDGSASDGANAGKESGKSTGKSTGGGTSGQSDKSDTSDEQSSSPGASCRTNDEDVTPANDDATTVRDSEKKLKELAEETTNAPPHLLMSPIDAKSLASYVVPASDYVARVEAMTFSASERTSIERDVTQWMTQYEPLAKHMAQEFDRRKKARAQERASTAKSGRLDMSKLHRFKFTDDLFRRTITVPRGQSHGIVMLIDGSSSMQDTFPNVMDQTLLFAQFAFHAHIPFEAYLFTDTASGRLTSPAATMALNPGRVSCKLIGLVNTNTERVMFKRQMRAALTLKRAVQRGAPTGVPYANLGGTPLFASMFIAERLVARMKLTLRLDKMLFCVLSDGGDGGGLYYTRTTVQSTGTFSGREERVNMHSPLIVRDSVTKRNYVIAQPGAAGQFVTVPNGLYKMLFDVIRDRHAAATMLMYLSAAYHDGAIAMTRFALPDADVTPLAKRCNDEGFVVLPKNGGVADAAIVIAQNKLALTEIESAGVGTETQPVEQQFVDMMVRRQQNRKFVNAIVPFVA